MCSQIPLPNRPHWFLLFGATEEEIQEICFKILQLYTRKKVDLTHLESEVEKRKHAIEEAKARAKGLLPGTAPGLDSAAGFSPAPKLGECPEFISHKGIAACHRLFFFFFLRFIYLLYLSTL